MNDCFISQSKMRAREERMKRLRIYENDLTEKFVHSSGKGGQNINKTSTCVYIRHIPTGFEVKCGRERSQAVNRFLARRILCDRIESALLGKQSAESQKIEKIRRPCTGGAGALP